MLTKEFKEQIHNACLEYVQQRVQNAEFAIRSVQSSAEEDTKSSAGDKFETSREMMKQELQRHQSLLQEAKQLENILHTIPVHEYRDQVQLGSLILTNKGLFYLSIGIGALKVGETSIFVLSPFSPVGKLLMNAKVQQTIRFNTHEYQVLGIV